MKNTNKGLFTFTDGQMISKLNLDQILPYSLNLNLENEENKSYSLIRDLFSQLITLELNQLNKNPDEKGLLEDKLSEDIKINNILFKINNNDSNDISQTDIYTANDLLNNISFVEVFADQIIEQLNNKLYEIEIENSNLLLSYKDYKSGVRFDDIIKKLSPEEETLLDVVRYFKQQELLGDTSLFSILNKLLDNEEYKAYLSSIDNQKYLYENIPIEHLEILLNSIISNSNELLNRLYEIKKLY